MNPLHLDATALMLWGLVAHLVADWLLQNEWMATNKAKRRRRHNPTTMTGERGTPYEGARWDRHPAAYVHAGIHGVLLSLVFGWVAVPLAVAHLVIDTRAPVAWWSRLIRQTQPSGKAAAAWDKAEPLTVVDIGMFVRFWSDQVWHIACIAVAALAVALT